MSLKKLLLIYNPHSGKALFKTKLADIVELYSSHNYLVTVIPTKEVGHAIDIVKEHANEYDIAVFSGGDGTLNEVINGLIQIENRPVIGYIPSGTVNDFATNFNLSKDPLTAAETILSGVPFCFDVGTLNDRSFTYISAFGLFTDVSYQTSQDMKSIWGRMAYILEGAKRLNHIPSYKLAITTDHGTITDNFLYGMITNSTSIGGFKSFSGKNVSLDDGLFEVVLAKAPRNPADLSVLLRCILTRTPDQEHLYACKTSRVKIVSEEAIDWTLDGEFGGSETSVIIQNHKQAVEIMVDKNNLTAL